VVSNTEPEQKEIYQPPIKIVEIPPASSQTALLEPAQIPIVSTETKENTV
jgi:hypothetical protein